MLHLPSYFYALAFVLLAFYTPLMGQGDSNFFKEDQNIFILGGGVAYADVAELSQVIYGDQGAIKQPVALSSTFHYGFYFNEHSLLITNLSRTMSWPKAKAEDYLEFSAVIVGMGYGYHINPAKAWSFLPEIGLGYVTHTIFYDRGLAAQEDVANQLTAPGTATRLRQERYSAEAKLNVLYKPKRAINPLLVHSFGLHLGFTQSFGRAQWFQRYNSELAGPTLFPQIFSAQLSFILKI